MKLIIDVDEKIVCKGFEQPLTEEERNILIRAIGNGRSYNPSGDLISRSDLKKTLKENEWITDDPFADSGALEEIIDNAPSIEAYPFEQVRELIELNQQFAQEIEDLKRPEGEWIEKEDTPASVYYCCSNCDMEGIPVTPFCPWCGAKMKGDAE